DRFIAVGERTGEVHVLAAASAYGPLRSRRTAGATVPREMANSQKDTIESTRPASSLSLPWYAVLGSVAAVALIGGSLSRVTGQVRLGPFTRATLPAGAPAHGGSCRITHNLSAAPGLPDPEVDRGRCPRPSPGPREHGLGGIWDGCHR